MNCSKNSLRVLIAGETRSNGSGAIFLASSPANENAFNQDETTTVKINVE
tara:strand:+ start:78 stop:227 length:150 start_codon:yes stop_codon:yes gene_type:complete